MKTIIAGSRAIDRYELVDVALSDAMGQGLVITAVVSGGARGIDQLGERWAREHSIPVTRLIPDWGKWGKRAGILRDEQMASVADALVAIWDGTSRGTDHMVSEGRRRGLVVHLYLVDELRRVIAAT